MKIVDAIFVMIIAGSVYSCNTQHTDDKTVAVVADSITTEQVPYTIAKNYFVKNTFTGNLENPKVSTQAAFDSIFGMATTMGEEGKPTVIDFQKEYVIAVIPAKSDTATTLSAIELTRKADEIDLKYSIAKGEKQSFVSQPVLLLIVDNKYSGVVKTTAIPAN